MAFSCHGYALSAWADDDSEAAFERQEEMRAQERAELRARAEAAEAKFSALLDAFLADPDFIASCDWRERSREKRARAAAQFKEDALEFVRERFDAEARS